MISQKVVLVNEKNKKIGVEEKLKAHKEGKLHRAISVLIFNSKGQILLQQREKTKYHCGGLWSNAVCTNPQPNETFKQAAHRRLKEEIGISCNLVKAFSFIYTAKFDNGLIENELDSVFIGQSDEVPKLNPKEVMDYKWVLLKDLKKDILNTPEKYTIWFKIILDKLTNKQIKEVLE
jgi:isopentenyl-diphosphate Delta-isomerase